MSNTKTKSNSPIAALIATLAEFHDAGSPGINFSALASQWGHDQITVGDLLRAAAEELQIDAPAKEKEKPELGENDRIEWAGFVIKRKRDFPASLNKFGYVVVKDGCNPMPGAARFSSVAQAQKGIAAFNIALKIAPKPIADTDWVTCDGDIFWMLMELTK